MNRFIRLFRMRKIILPLRISLVPLFSSQGSDDTISVLIFHSIYRYSKITTINYHLFFMYPYTKLQAVLSHEWAIHEKSMTSPFSGLSYYISSKLPS